MKLLVIILCLLSERFLIHSISYQRFSWFPQYSHHMLEVARKYAAINLWLQLLFVITPVILGTALVYWLFHNVLFGFVGLLLSIVIVYYCLGPNNVFYPMYLECENDAPDSQVANYFSQSNRQLFSVIFWYLLGGPIFALFYRLIDLCRSVSPIQNQANQIADWFEWIPVRIMILLFLFVGNFQKGFSCFMTSLFDPPAHNEEFIGKCGLLAINTSDAEEISLSSAERFVEYAVVVFLVFVAIFTLVAWI